MASSNPIHWPTYLDTALLSYFVSHHHIIRMSPFNTLYGRDNVLPLSVLPISSVAGPGSADAGMRLIASKLIRLQALAADALLKTTTRESNSRNALRPELFSVFNQ